MRRRQNHECAVLDAPDAARRRRRGRLPAALGTDVRRGDRRTGRRSPSPAPARRPCTAAIVSRISLGSAGYADPACAGSRTGARRELAARRSSLHRREVRRPPEIPALLSVSIRCCSQLADFEFAGDPHQRRAQVQIRLLAVEALQALHQHRRNDQHRVGEPVWIADEQPRVLRRGRRHEVQIHAQAGQWIGHDFIVSRASARYLRNSS